MSKNIKLKNLINENHALGVLPSSKLMKMKWNPLTESEPADESESMNESTDFGRNYNRYHDAMGNIYKIISKQDKSLARQFAKSWQDLEDVIENYENRDV